MTDFPMNPPMIDQATIDHYVAKGSRERSLAVRAMFRGLFGTSQQTAAPGMKTVRGGAIA